MVRFRDVSGREASSNRIGSNGRHVEVRKTSTFQHRFLFLLSSNIETHGEFNFVFSNRTLLKHFSYMFQYCCVEWTEGWMIDWMIEWSNDRMIEWLNDRMIEWSNDRMIERSNDRTIERSNDRTIERSNDRTIERSNDRTIEWSNDRNIAWLIWSLMNNMANNWKIHCTFSHPLWVLCFPNANAMPSTLQIVSIQDKFTINIVANKYLIPPIGPIQHQTRQDHVWEWWLCELGLPTRWSVFRGGYWVAYRYTPVRGEGRALEGGGGCWTGWGGGGGKQAAPAIFP